MVDLFLQLVPESLLCGSRSPGPRETEVERCGGGVTVEMDKVEKLSRNVEMSPSLRCSNENPNSSNDVQMSSRASAVTRFRLAGKILSMGQN